MDRLIYTAMSGANAAASRQSVLSNNLANASTNGFRAELSTYRAVPLQGDGATTRVFAVEATAGYLDRPGPAQFSNFRAEAAPGFCLGNRYHQEVCSTGQYVYRPVACRYRCSHCGCG